MADIPEFKCSCNHCGVNLEFPKELNGTAIACPSCQQETFLMVEQDECEAAGAPAPKITYDMIVEGFNGHCRKSGAGLLYQLGLAGITMAIVLLPIFYVALVAAAGWCVVWWAKAGLFLLTLRAGLYGLIFMIFLYLAPIFGGAVAVFF